MDKWILCVVALILGMLMANMFKNVCGCKTVDSVEGQVDKFLEDLYNQYKNKNMDTDEYLSKLLDNEYIDEDTYDNLKTNGMETQGWGELCASPLPPWCKDKANVNYGGGDLNCSTEMHCGQQGCPRKEDGTLNCGLLGPANTVYPKDCIKNGCLINNSKNVPTTLIKCDNANASSCGRVKN